jgi:hypothetical protein
MLLKVSAGLCLDADNEAKTPATIPPIIASANPTSIMIGDIEMYDDVAVLTMNFAGITMSISGEIIHPINPPIKA